MRTRASARLIPVFLALGCGSSPPAARPESPELAKPKNPQPVATGPSAKADPDASSVVNDALAEVARRRQLRPTGGVTGRTISRDEMVERVKQQLRREVPEPVIAAQKELLFGLGTVSASFEYEKSLLDLMGAQLAGFYEPKAKTMFLARDLPPLEQEATLAHELVHALQDQHYDLEKLIAYRPDAGDKQSAVHSFAEGDATSAMIDHMLAPRGLTALDISEDLFSLEARGSVEMTPASADVPGVLKRSVIAPYTDGVVFVNWARRQGGWARVDQVWAKPPATTEQLLHPEKYAAQEPGQDIPVPAAPPNGPTKITYRDIMGEQSLRILFEEWMPRKIAIEAATGWGGDRIAVFADEGGGRFALAWHVRYDDEPSASRALEAFARGVLRRDDAKPTELVDPKEARAAARPGSTCRNRGGAGPFAVLRKGADLAVVAGPWERTAGGARGRGSCAEALGWARKIAAQ